MKWIVRHPNLATWALLAIGMVAALTWSARGVEDLTSSQWSWLVGATVLVAGLCAWIISWEADELDAYDDQQEDGNEQYLGNEQYDVEDRSEDEETADEG